MVLSFLFALIFLPAICQAQIVERQRPAEWKQLVAGGQFIDLFEPMPIMAPLTSETWGGDNVLPRDITNGIEDPNWSYWCGDPLQSDDGVYHLFTVRWPENDPRGHFAYHDSIVVHATASHPLGPYKVQETIGPGHNSDIYQTSQGEYVIYCTHGRYYISKTLHGPWKAGLLGRTSAGNVLFGWSRLPGVQYKVSILSALSPKFEFTDDGLDAYIEVQNFGQFASPTSKVHLYRTTESGVATIGEATMRALQPFEKSVVRIQCTKILPRGSKPTVTIALESIGLPVEHFTRTVTLPTNSPCTN